MSRNSDGPRTTDYDLEQRNNGGTLCRKGKSWIDGVVVVRQCPFIQADSRPPMNILRIADEELARKNKGVSSRQESAGSKLDETNLICWLV